MRQPREPLPTDLTDAEWAQVEPLIPPPERLGRARSTDLREVMNAIRLRWQTGLPWRLLPKGFPPWATVYTYYRAWRKAGVLHEMRSLLGFQDPLVESPLGLQLATNSEADPTQTPEPEATTDAEPQSLPHPTERQAPHAYPDAA